MFTLPAFSASGTGFIISSDGYIISSLHVVQKAKKISVRLKNGKVLNATIVRTDPNNDLVVLKVNETNLKAASIISSSSIQRGEKVYTIGFPQFFIQGTEPKLTDGIISSLTGIKDEPSSFQITNPIQPGNSGGPLFTEDGLIIGVVNSTLSAVAVLKATGSLPQNVNFATKSNYLIELLNTIDKAKFRTAQRVKSFKKLTSVISEIEESLVFITTIEDEQPQKVVTQPQPAPNQTTKPNIPSQPPKVSNPGITASTPPSQSNNSRAYRGVSLLMPELVENGAVTPVGITVSPSLKAGDFLAIFINGKQASRVEITFGELEKFNTRFIFNEPITSVSVQCSECNPRTLSSRVTLIAPVHSVNSSPENIRMIGNQSEIKALIAAQSTSSGKLFLVGNDLNLNVLLTPYVTRDPFFGFNGSIKTGQYCIRYQTSGEVSGCVHVRN